jgi:hypothetical protein
MFSFSVRARRSGALRPTTRPERWAYPVGLSPGRAALQISTEWTEVLDSQRLTQGSRSSSSATQSSAAGPAVGRSNFSGVPSGIEPADMHARTLLARFRHATLTATSRYRPAHDLGYRKASSRDFRCVAQFPHRVGCSRIENN